MKKPILYITALLMGVALRAQIGDNVTEPSGGGTYIIDAQSGPVSLRATSSITLLPGAWIQEGADFGASINGDVYVPLSLTANTNYIYTRTYQEGMSSAASIASNGDVLEQVGYFDGLGRPVQQIAVKASPGLMDIVTHVGYDGFGRQAREWLPYPAGGTVGGHRSTAKSGTEGYYTANYAEDINGASPNPYSETGFEASPLNRVLKQAAPGHDWRMGGGHEIDFAYAANGAGEVRLYEVGFANGDTEAPQLTANGHYPAAELQKNVTRDENHDGSGSKDHTTEEFTDKQGRVVLKRTYDNETPHDTYYVYDDFGNLTYVLPPKVDTANGISATELAELCYQYRYDYRNRLVEKKVPGKEWEYIVYNRLDQAIMTRDANLGANDQWLFTKYDALGRVVYTGRDDNTTATRSAAQNAADNANLTFETGRSTSANLAGTPMYHTNDAYPTSFDKVFTVNYYDSYVDTDGLSVPASVYGAATTTEVTGLPTVSRVRVLGTDDWITTITGYDQKGRAIYSASKNDYLGTMDIVETQLDFAGKVLETRTTHTKGGNAPIVTVDRFEYDHAARLVQQEQQLAGHTELIAHNAYDGIGQLVKKEVGNTLEDPLQEVDYKYNVRGWLKQINNPNSLGSDLFAFGINYNDPAHSGTALFNGNIAETEWKTASDNQLRWYRYGHDAMDRIVSAIDNTTDQRYSLTNVSYDKNGNITNLVRNGHRDVNATNFGLMDDLTFQYNGNQLRSVGDAPSASAVTGFIEGAENSTEYQFDQNGNMTRDDNKKITSVEYNHLNMPTKITVTGSNAGTLDYVYDATGGKIRKINSNGTTTDYAGNFVYEGGNLKQISHPEGYIEPNGSNWQYVYYLKDHQRNVRITFADDNDNGSIDPTTEIRREQNHFPFGLEHKGYNSALNGVKNNLKTYQDQEFTEDLGLNIHEWRFRFSDPTTGGRFWQIDPLAEEYSYQSPYNFSENRVVDAVELEGLEKLSVHILGSLTVNGSSANAVGTATVDLRNDNRGSFALAIEGAGTISGTFTPSEGITSTTVSENNPEANRDLAFSIMKPKGFRTGDFLARKGLESKLEEITPKTIEEALSLSEEEAEANQVAAFGINSLLEMIDAGMIDTFVDFTDFTETEKGENGETKERKFTNTFKFRTGELEFDNDGIRFNGQLLIEYNQEEEDEN